MNYNSDEMQILDLPERDLKKRTRIFALEYIKNNSYYNSKIVITNFLLLDLELSPKSKKYAESKGKMRYDLRKITHKLLNIGIIIPYNTQCYRINRKKVSEYTPFLANVFDLV
ncbi:hypothetical protein ES702_03454 [subsurface metagenome]